MSHEPRRRRSWLIFDVGLYPLLFDMRRFEMRFLRAHAVGRAAFKGFHVVDVRGCSDARSGWRVFEPVVLERQLIVAGDPKVFVAVGGRL